MKKLLCSFLVAAVAVLFVAGSGVSDAAWHKKANPCAAKKANPCNPCAAKKANPCNPCAAKKANPCNPCAAKK